MVHQLIGKVVSTAMMKSITVSVERAFRHPILPKIIRKHKKFIAHDETSQAKLGDVVRIVECRPISRRKHFTLQEILKTTNSAAETTAASTASS